MTPRDLFTQLIDFILTSQLEGDYLIEALESKYCVTEKPEDSLRCIDKYKLAFENDYITDEKVCKENGFNLTQIAQCKFEFWNSKELDDNILLNSYKEVQKHFLNWCRMNRKRIKDHKNGEIVKAVQPTIKQIVQEEKKQRPKYAETEAEYLWKEAMKKQFELFKESKILNPVSPSRQYKIFVERGLINEGDLDNFFEQAKEILLTQKKMLRTFPESKFHRDALTDSIHRIQEGNLSDNDKAEIRGQQSLLSIENYYSSISELKI